jgi:hypothetical protein
MPIIVQRTPQTLTPSKTIEDSLPPGLWILYAARPTLQVCDPSGRHPTQSNMPRFVTVRHCFQFVAPAFTYPPRYLSTLARAVAGHTFRERIGLLAHNTPRSTAPRASFGARRGNGPHPAKRMEVIGVLSSWRGDSRVASWSWWETSASRETGEKEETRVRGSRTTEHRR